MPLPLSLFLSCHSLFLPFPFHISCLFLSFSSMPLSPLVSPSPLSFRYLTPYCLLAHLLYQVMQELWKPDRREKRGGAKFEEFCKVPICLLFMSAAMHEAHVTSQRIWDIQQHCSTYTGLQVNLQLCEELGRHRPLSSRWLAQIHHHIKQHISEPAARPDCVKAFNPSDLGQGGKCCRLIELASF